MTPVATEATPTPTTEKPSERERLWRAFWVALGRWSVHRLAHDPRIGDGPPCNHKEQRDFDAAADAYLAVNRRTAYAVGRDQK